VSRYNITGIADIVNGPRRHLGTPKVTLHFGSDSSGVYGLKSAEATLEEMVRVPAIPVPGVKVRVCSSCAPVFPPPPSPSPGVQVEVVKPTPKPKKSRTPLFSAKKNTTSTVNDTDSANATATATESPEPTPVEPVGDEDAKPTADPAADAGEDKVAADAAGAEAGADVSATPTPEPVKVMKKVVHRIPLKVSADYSDLSVRPLTDRQRGKSLRTYVVFCFPDPVPAPVLMPSWCLCGE
jgi:hypothetical protein